MRYFFLFQHYEVFGIQEKVQRELTAIWRHGCDWAVLCWPFGHAVSHQKSADQASASYSISSSFTIFLLRGHGRVPEPIPAAYGEGRVPCWMGTLCKHLVVHYLTQGYLSRALKVSWYLVLLPQHLRSFVCSGAWTKNPPLSPVPYKLSIKFNPFSYNVIMDMEALSKAFCSIILE